MRAFMSCSWLYPCHSGPATSSAPHACAATSSAFFAGRHDIEIAGDPDATYIDVINAINAAQTAGFTTWRLTDPYGLSARPQQ